MSTTNKRSARRARVAKGRPQDAASTDALLAATLEVVAERGYHEATLDEIVSRAGSSKPTVYRRWKGKPQLVAGAIRHALSRANPTVPATGDPYEDTRILLQNTIRTLDTTPLGGVLRALVSAAERDRELAGCLRAVEQDRRVLLWEAVSRFDPKTTELTVDTLLGAIYFRLLVRRIPLSPSLAGELVGQLKRRR